MDVGDSLLLETPDAVDGKGLHRDHMDFARVDRRFLLPGDPGELLEQPGEVGGSPPRASTRQPGPARRRAAGAWPPTRIGMGWVGVGEIFTDGRS